MLRNRRFWLGLVVSLAFLALFFVRIDLGDLALALREANYIYILPAIALYFAAVVFRTWRWKYILRSLRPLPSRRLFPVVVVGYAANNLLPVRLGELVRSYYLGAREGVSKTAALATVVVERVFDGLVLLFLLAVSALFLPLIGLVNELGDSARLPGWLLATLVLVPFLIALALLVGMAVYPQAARRLMQGVARWLPKRVGPKLQDLLELFLEGLSILRSPRRLVVVFALSLPIWLMEGAMYYVVAIAFDLQGQFGSAALLGPVILAVLATSNLVTSLPSSQGGVGPFEFFAAATLIILGTEASLASAYAVALHVTLLAPVTVLGLIYLWTDNLTLAQLTRRSERRDTPGAERGASALPTGGEKG